jgi:hypothetical protein
MKKFNKTLLVAAMALAATGTAQARISNVTNAAQFTGSELVLTVWNTTLEKSFSQDLGVKQSDFLANTSLVRNWTINDANLTNFLAGNGANDNIIYNVASGSSSLSGQSALVSGGIYDGLTKKTASLTGYGLVTTGTGTLADFSAVTNSSAKINNASSAINGNNLNVNAGSNEITGADTVNASLFAATPADTGYAGTAFGTNFDGTLGSFNTTAAVGSDLSLFRASLNPALTSQAVFAEYDNKINFSVAGGVGTLKFAPVVSAVPLPAAVWLFGAGLMGVLRLNRRKSIAA